MACPDTEPDKVALRENSQAQGACWFIVQHASPRVSFALPLTPCLRCQQPRLALLALFSYTVSQELVENSRALCLVASCLAASILQEPVAAPLPNSETDSRASTAPCAAPQPPSRFPPRFRKRILLFDLWPNGSATFISYRFPFL